MERLLRNKWTILQFVLPALLLYAAIMFIPIISSIYYSFFKWNLLSTKEFIGFGNFIRMFTWDDVFPIAIKNGLIILFVSVVFQQLLGFTFAAVLSENIKFKNTFKNIIFMPAVLSSVAVGLMWTFIYNPKIGIVNAVLRTIGLDNLTRSWLSDPSIAIWAVGAVVIWQYTGYAMTLYFAAIQNIPKSINESTYIDGASSLKRLWYITIPMIKPIIKINMILAAVGSLKFFDLIYAMTGGGPVRSTEVLASYMYSRAFTQFQYGFGNALSVVLLILCLILTAIISKLFKSEDVEY